MKIRYYNEYFNQQYGYLRVIIKEHINEMHFVWWELDDYKHPYTVGQWIVKKKTIAQKIMSSKQIEFFSRLF